MHMLWQLSCLVASSLSLLLLVLPLQQSIHQNSFAQQIAFQLLALCHTRQLPTLLCSELTGRGLIHLQLIR